MQRLTKVNPQKLIWNNIFLGCQKNLSCFTNQHFNYSNRHNHYRHHNLFKINIKGNLRSFTTNNDNSNNSRTACKDRDKDKRRTGSFSMPNNTTERSNNNNDKSRFSPSNSHSKKAPSSRSTSTQTPPSNFQAPLTKDANVSSIRQSRTSNDNDNDNLNKEKTVHKKSSITRTTKITDTKTTVHEESQHFFRTKIQSENQTLNIDIKEEKNMNTIIDHNKGEPTQSHQKSTELSSRTVTMNSNDSSGYIESMTTQNEIQETKDIEPLADGNPNSNFYAPSQSSEISLPIPNEIGDIFAVGNPSIEEIERRKKILKTPYAIIVHPSRLLSRESTTEEKQQHSTSHEKGLNDFTYRIRQKVIEITKTISTRIIGQEKFEKFEEDLKTRHKTWKESWDNTQHPYIIKVRSLVDKLQMQTEQSKAMELLQKEMGSLWIEDLLPEFKAFMIPKIVNAYLQDDLAYLNSICVGEAAVFVRNMIEARIKANIQISPQILFHDDVELIEMKVTSDKKAALIIRADVQSVDCVYERGTKKVVEGSPSSIANNVFLLTIEPNFDKEHMKKTNFPWQIRQIQTAKLRQLV